MDPSLRKLLEIGGVPFAGGIGSSIDVLDHLGEIGTSIRDVLAKKNGFFCLSPRFNSFLQLPSRRRRGLAEWNSSDLWKADYRGLADNIFCFAEDVFGQQFVVHEGKIGTFEVETWRLHDCRSFLRGMGFNDAPRLQSNDRLQPRTRMASWAGSSSSAPPVIG